MNTASKRFVASIIIEICNNVPTYLLLIGACIDWYILGEMNESCFIHSIQVNHNNLSYLLNQFRHKYIMSAV